MDEIIDFRCRPPFGNFVKDWIFNLEDVPGNPGLKTKFSCMGMQLPASLLQRSMEAFFQENQACGVALSVVPLRKLATQDNDDLAALLHAYPDKFVGLAGIQPLADGMAASLEAVKRHVLHGPCAGIYMEPGLDPVPWLVDDEVFFPLYELCEEKDIPVCLLFGGVFHRKSAPDYEHYAPMRIEHVARAFPRLKIALSHACWPWTAHACAVALNWEHVYLSPDGFMIDHPGAQDYVVAANYRLQDKIFFGSLYPGVPVGYAVERYRSMLRPKVWDKVFHRNAARFLNMKISPAGTPRAGHGDVRVGG